MTKSTRSDRKANHGGGDSERRAPALRLNDLEHSLLTAAAAAENKTISAFMRAVTTQAARRILFRRGRLDAVLRRAERMVARRRQKAQGLVDGTETESA